MLAIALAGCGEGTPPTAPRFRRPHPGEGGRPAAPWLLLAGEHAGELVPCGCAKPQLGGVVQRAAMLARWPRRVLVEIGNVVDRPGRQSQLKYEAFVDAIQEMGCAALVVGDRELALGMDAIATAVDGRTVPVLAANLVGPSGTVPFRPWASVVVGDAGVEQDVLAIVGLVSGTVQPVTPGWRATDPVEALALALASIPSANRLLVAGTFDEAVARRLAAALGGRAALIAYGRGAAGPGTRTSSVGRATLLGIGGRGHHLAAIDLGEPGWTEPVVHPVLEATPVPAVQAVLARYQAAVATADLLGKVARLPARARYVGSGACRDCHAQAHEIWEGSRHARAMESLVRVGFDRDPECVSCHVVGYGDEGGFTRPGERPELDRVGCESCHGPGGEHVDRGGTRETITRGSPATCARCHQKDHDPHFEHADKWPAISH